MTKEKFIANAKLIERDINGGQKYQLDRVLHGFNTLWITGWCCASNLKIGDDGIIVYESSPSYGLFFFRKGMTEDKYKRGSRR